MRVSGGTELPCLLQWLHTLNRHLLAVNGQLDLGRTARTRGEVADGIGLGGRALGAPKCAQQLLPHHLVLPTPRGMWYGEEGRAVSVGGCGGGGGVVETSINWNRCSSLVLSPRTLPYGVSSALIGAAMYCCCSHLNAV
jgi:hypothetical protein